MLLAAAFDSPDFQTHTTVDKRGRRVSSASLHCLHRPARPRSASEVVSALPQVKSSKGKDDMRKYYRIQDEVPTATA